MYLEITNDIHLGLKFGCCNAENRKNGVTKYITEIVLNEILLLRSSKKDDPKEE